MGAVFDAGAPPCRMPFTDLPQPFLRAEALAAGLTERRLDALLGAGSLTRVASGVYAVASPWETSPPWTRHLGLARAAVRATPDAIISHASAAALLELPMPPNPPLRATMTLLDDRRTSEDDGWRRFHRGRTPPGHIVIDRGHPYLVPARTVVDCMRDMWPGDALAVADAALSARLVAGPDLVGMRRHQKRWPGITAADRLMRLADGRRESWFESKSAWGDGGVGTAGRHPTGGRHGLAGSFRGTGRRAVARARRGRGGRRSGEVPARASQRR